MAYTLQSLMQADTLYYCTHGEKGVFEFNEIEITEFLKDQSFIDAYSASTLLGKNNNPLTLVEFSSLMNRLNLKIKLVMKHSLEYYFSGEGNYSDIEAILHL